MNCNQYIDIHNLLPYVYRPRVPGVWGDLWGGQHACKKHMWTLLGHDDRVQGSLGHGLANHASSGRPCVVLVRGARRVRPAASLHARAAVVVMESSARGQRRGDLLPA